MIALLAWIAVTLEMSGNWLIGSKRRWGFLIKILGSVAWLVMALMSNIGGLIVSAILGGFISYRNFRAWRQRN